MDIRSLNLLNGHLPAEVRGLVLVRVDFHSGKELPRGALHAILKAAGIERPKRG